MIKEVINILAEDIEYLTNTTLDMCECSLEECFPSSVNKEVDINGEKYMASIEVNLLKL